jgi:hypothetical protein
VPSKAYWHDGGIGEATARARADFGALNPVVDSGRKEHLESIEPAEDLLRRDDAEAARVRG